LIASWCAALATIDRYLLHAPEQTSRTALLLSIDGTDRRTDRQKNGQMDSVPLQRRSPLEAGSVNKCPN